MKIESIEGFAIKIGRFEPTDPHWSGCELNISLAGDFSDQDYLKAVRAIGFILTHIPFEIVKSETFGEHPPQADGDSGEGVTMSVRDAVEKLLKELNNAPPKQ